MNTLPPLDQLPWKVVAHYTLLLALIGSHPAPSKLLAQFREARRIYDDMVLMSPAPEELIKVASEELAFFEESIQAAIEDAERRAAG